MKVALFLMGLNTAVVGLLLFSEDAEMGLPSEAVNIPFPCVPTTIVLSDHLLAIELTTAVFSISDGFPDVPTSLLQTVADPLTLFVLNNPMEVPT